MRRGLALALLALVLAGCGGHPAPAALAVGAGPQPESALLGHLYAAALRYYGTPAAVTVTDGAPGVLDSGEVTVQPGFTGRLLTALNPATPARSDEQVYRELVSALPEGVAAGDYAMSAQDKPAVVVTKATASEWGGTELAALRRHCAAVRPGVLASAQAPAAVGSCSLPKAREFPDDVSLFAALRAGKINAAWSTTADPAIPSDLTVLNDETALIRAENVVPLYRRNMLDERQILALNEIAGVLDTATLADMRRQVAHGADPGAVAEAFLQANPLGH
ncbi:glycine betaine/choline ABC-type transport system substrate-binding protein [Mycobacterium frederiksbergense]|uniref:Glycine betaine/choline ABC-type transport system substrate-binding protein n=1 Tax=Mycolicibacterium frederiksbergense TaxID=117567 RepID=A0ABT6L3L7_9MYCO|nr:glycine betaine ABC transporter substrate-binding protein [Mycolicibacterium frederiksbergense]MDH6197541.1 glycine betaine/choline ABC-type transport system substrate-binding protein [Mycolicibacterium frederiksbergense]